MRYRANILKDWAQQLWDRMERGVGSVREALRDGAEAASAGGDRSPVRTGTDSESLTEDDGLPVVARLVVEIRSDGSRTLARGAIEDGITGERTSIEARGDSPAQLAGALAASLVQTPLHLGKIATEVLAARLRRGRG